MKEYGCWREEWVNKMEVWLDEEGQSVRCITHLPAHLFPFYLFFFLSSLSDLYLLFYAPVSLFIVFPRHLNTGEMLFLSHLQL